MTCGNPKFPIPHVKHQEIASPTLICPPANGSKAVGSVSERILWIFHMPPVFFRIANINMYTPTNINTEVSVLVHATAFIPPFIVNKRNTSPTTITDI